MLYKWGVFRCNISFVYLLIILKVFLNRFQPESTVLELVRSEIIFSNSCFA